MEVHMNPQTQNKAVPRWWLGGMLVFSFFGFLDASYLTAKHYLGFQVPCTILDGCEQVLTSQYASIFGIPVALFGAAYYLAVFLFVVAYVDRKQRIFLQGAVLLPIAGFLASAGFMVIQVFILNAFCFYCVLSAALTTVLFALSLHFIWHGYFKSDRRNTAV
jgi:uncharacterized membrane protein